MIWWKQPHDPALIFSVPFTASDGPRGPMGGQDRQEYRKGGPGMLMGNVAQSLLLYPSTPFNYVCLILISPTGMSCEETLLSHIP